MFLGAACRDVVSPDAGELPAELCDLLRRCEGEQWSCPSGVTELFERQEDPESLYQGFLTRDCLADCQSARACRDYEPLCGAPGAACEEDAGCCGFTSGLARCGVGVEESGRCCSPRGVRCASSDDCCERDCTASPSGELTCGGVEECLLVGALCESDFDCCSYLCGADGRCAQITCSDTGESCVEDTDCCDDQARCAGGVCSSDTCSSCDPFDPNNCCVTGEGQFCFETVNHQTLCAPADCPPAGVECGGDDDCACASEPAASLFCNDAAGFYCAECKEAGSTCDPTVEPPEAHGCCGACDAETSLCTPP